jgi:hypothetical protein
MCCGCHRHKVRRIIQLTYSPELGIPEKSFWESMSKHIAAAEEKLQKESAL